MATTPPTYADDKEKQHVSGFAGESDTDSDAAGFADLIAEGSFKL
jgi:hypothetical protein